jgi:hypothetical protein
MLAFATNGNGAGGDPAGDYVGHVHANGTLAAFQHLRVCPGSSARFRRLARRAPSRYRRSERITPSAKAAIRRGPDTTYVAAVDGGRIAVQHANGSVTLLLGGGRAADADRGAVRPLPPASP